MCELLQRLIMRSTLGPLILWIIAALQDAILSNDGGIAIAVNSRQSISVALCSDQIRFQPFLESLSLYLANFNVISPSAEGGHAAFAKRYAEILEKNGLEGQQFACGFFDDLKKDLGKAARDCLERDFLQKHRASDWSPFPLIVALEHFKCGDGFKAVENNFECLRKAHINHEKLAGHCKTPDMTMEKCSDWDKLIKCEREAFAKECGKEAGDHRAAELKIHEKISGVNCRKDH